MICVTGILYEFVSVCKCVLTKNTAKITTPISSLDHLTRAYSTTSYSTSYHTKTLTGG